MYEDNLRPPTELPPRDDVEYYDLDFVSVRVLAFTRRWLVAYVRQYEDCELKWISGCSEGWDITREVKGWIPLPPIPEIKP